ncbi:MAG: type II toxin-antitoxin system mRNA interferase toxin, RelE/StbE family [Candidatus Uhrbacteria bacterium]
MIANFHQKFRKQLRKLNAKQREQSRERIKQFLRNPNDPQLRDHALHGPYVGYRSINVSGDLRAVYTLVADDTCIFVAIGTHSALYE